MAGWLKEYSIYKEYGCGNLQKFLHSELWRDCSKPMADITRSSATIARRAMLVNSYFVSRAMGVIKVSNSKSDLQGHSRALAKVPFDRPHAISY